MNEAPSSPAPLRGAPDTAHALRNIAHALRVAAARAWQAFGWPGAAGAGLILSASLVLGSAWQAGAGIAAAPAAGALPEPEQDAPSRRADEPVAGVAAAALPHRGEAPLLLKQIAQAALDNGLGWPAAEYLMSPASADQPARLEVRCMLKGPYPALRSMLVQVLTTVPATTLRELSMSRSASDVAEVDAKLVFAVLTADEAAATATAQPAPQAVR